MEIKKNVSLKKYNSFGIDVLAKQFVSISNTEELKSVLKHHKSPYFIISGGSNMLLTKDVDALVIHINSKGIQVENKENHSLVFAKAGENWHDFVQFCISKNLGGLENLSLIPGCVGSAPIQNIGAYGVEIKDTFVSCKAIEINSLEEIIFTNNDCKFGYRDSIFKNEVKGKYIITEVTFKLTNKTHQLKTSYGAIEDELDKNNISTPSIKEVANAVIAIRNSKLPNPKILGNSGSFFKNPVISTRDFNRFINEFPEGPHYVLNQNEVKVPAGWLIDNAGLKGYQKGNAAVHDKQALVLVNKTGKATGKEIWDLALYVQSTVKNKYNILLEPEVNLF